MTTRSRASVLPLLLAGGLAAGAPLPPDRVADEPALEAPAVRPVPPADCAFVASDRDGVIARREAARASTLLASSHGPAALGAPVPADGLPGVAPRTVPRVNFVDDEIFGAMDAAGVKPAPLSSDAEFLRRVTLDLTGRIPDAAAVRAFLADTSPDKRAKAIDQLLASDAFVDRWAFFLDELFRNTANPDSGRLYPVGRNALHAWFAEGLRSRKPWDQMARELIATVGDNVAAPAGSFVVRNIQTNGPRQDTYDNLASSTGAVFLGTNALFCTTCHDGKGHLDLINLWGSTVRRQDLWEMSAFFARTTARSSGTPPNVSYAVADGASGDYALNTKDGNKTPRDGTWTEPKGLTSITPSFVLTGEAPAKGESYRVALARMVTAHPQFARSFVNYLWKELFSVGIVEPADAFDLARQDPQSPPPAPWTIQPTHPRLLVKLGDELQRQGYDLRSILRTMATSSAYQLSAFYPGTWSEAHVPYFARHYARRLPAEMILDAVTKATGVPASLTVSGTTTPVAFALQLPDSVGEPAERATRLFLDAFVRGDRDTDARSYQGSISQALSLMNDTIVTQRVKAATKGSTVSTLIGANAAPDVIVETLYLSTLSRFPTASERTAAVALFSSLGAGQTKATVAEDLQHALLNKLDFLFKY